MLSGLMTLSSSCLRLCRLIASGLAGERINLGLHRDILVVSIGCPRSIWMPIADHVFQGCIREGLRAAVACKLLPERPKNFRLMALPRSLQALVSPCRCTKPRIYSKYARYADHGADWARWRYAHSKSNRNIQKANALSQIQRGEQSNCCFSLPSVLSTTGEKLGR